MEFFAHRGDSRNCIENTRRAFESSLNLGFRAMEMDLAHLKDDTVVIFHDSDLGRLGRADCNIKSLTLAEFRALFPDLMTFAEFGELYADRDITINFEIKDGMRTFFLIRFELKKFKNVVISSFDKAIVDEAIRQGFEGGYLFEDIRELDGLREREALYLSKRLHIPFQPDMDHALLFALTEFDLYCYTVNDPGQARDLSVFPNVRGIFTDNPALITING